MSVSTQISYDALPYSSVAFPQTHPDRMNVIGRLFGMTPAMPSRARVLEIGCASGGNLIPMASVYPEASFVGIDLSARQIADGNAVIAETGFRNCELRQMNLMDVEASLGQFDYVIAHGVYSWVPPAVQDRLLAVCKERLTPQGIAYVSYNTYPGWHMRGMVRDMMVYHAQRFATVTQKVQQARALLDFLSENVPTDSGPYGLLLKQEVETIRRSQDSYIAHEFLEEHNEPLYFHQFAERAGAHRLQYLGEAEFNSMLASNFPPKVAETLQAIAPTIVQLEQYMDFLRNRVFRQSLLIHDNIILNRSVTWQSVEPYLVSSPLKPAVPGPLDFNSPGAVTFSNGAKAGITTPVPIVKAALTILSEIFPQAITVRELRVEARKRVGDAAASESFASPSRDAELLGSDILGCYAAGIVELRVEPLRFTTTVSERPKVDALARSQAARGLPMTNRRHEQVSFDELTRQVMPHMDGSRDHAALVDVMAGIAATDALQIRKGPETVRDPALIRTVLVDALPQSYAKLARTGFLEA